VYAPGCTLSTGLWDGQKKTLPEDEFSGRIFRKGFQVPDGSEWRSLHLLDRFAWTNLSAGAAIGALIRVDHVFGIALGDTLNRTFRRAVSASNTFVGNQIGHFQILIKITKLRLISLSNPVDMQESIKRTLQMYLLHFAERFKTL
jgi:hypothetical protein